MHPITLHYIYDPLCGWCYAVAPLLRAAREILPVSGHAGGMMTGARRQQVSPALRDYVMPHDQRITALTGQPFGDAYFNGLLLDTTAVFDSAPPIRAILAADLCGARGLDMLARLQTAHYVEGRKIAERNVLDTLAAELGLPADAFAPAWQAVTDERLQQHIGASRQLLAQVGGSGFPTFALEQDGRFTMLDIGRWLGQADGWRKHLQQYLQA